MKVGATAECDDEHLKAVTRYGIKHVVSAPPIAEPGRLYATDWTHPGPRRHHLHRVQVGRRKAESVADARG